MEGSLRYRAKKLKFTDSEDICTGRRPCITILPEKNIAVLFIDCSVSRSLYYFIGHLQADGETIDWGPGVPYTTGNCPTAAVVSLEDSIFVIEAHNTHFGMFRKQSHYNLWKMNVSTRKMQGNCDGTTLSRGLKPRISANEEGWAVAISETSSSEYHIGKLEVDQNNDPQIRWTRQSNICFGKSPDVSFCGKKVVLVYRDTFSIKTVVGELHEDQRQILWHSQTGQPTTLRGLSPSVSLNSNGMVVLCYQSVLFREVIAISGNVNNQNIVSLNNESKTGGETNGEYPFVFLTDSSTVFLVYKKGFGTKLRLKTGIADHLQESTPVPPHETAPNAGP